MPEKSATTSLDTVVFPPGRYGRRREARRSRPWLMAVLLVAALAATSVISVRLYQMYGDPHYRAQVITYTDITDSQIRVDFRVTVPEGESAICLLRARSRDGAEVARAEVRVDTPPGETHPMVSHQLATSARPLLGEVLRCRAAD